MLAIPIKNAIERLAQTIEQADLDDLIEIYAELFPAKPLTELKTATAAMLGENLAKHVRNDIGPEEVADLWNVVFPDGPSFYYDEEEGALRQSERGLRYTGF